MKLIHTPLGALASKKKFIASVAALAFVGGIAPALINNTHAEEEEYYDPGFTTFTVVGPYYYTYLGGDDGHLNFIEGKINEGYSVRIEDTSVADFYTGPNIRFAHYIERYDGTELLQDDVCDVDYACLQGKKVGSTEILFEKSGASTIHMPIRSVKLTPAGINFEEFGGTISITGSIEGATNDILQLIGTGSTSGVEISVTGERSATIGASNAQDIREEGALVWRIGYEYVGGGSYYSFVNVEGVDNVYNLPENKEILKRAALNAEAGYEDYFYTAMNPYNPPFNPSNLENIDIDTPDGSIFHLNDMLAFPGRPIDIKNQGVLDLNDANLTKTEKDKLKSELPDGSKSVTFKDILVSVKTQATIAGGGGGTVVHATESGNNYEATIGYYKTLSSPLTMAIDVSDVEAVADGYTRKWYVVRDNDGTIEKLEAAYDEDTKTIRFDTKVFGPHAYGYVDEAIKEEPAGGSVAPKVPNTGSPIQKVAKTAAITFAPLVAIIFGAFMVRNRKKASNKLAKKHNHFE